MRVQVNTRSSSRDYAASAILSLALLLLLFGDRISKIGVPWGASDMTMYYNLVRYWNFWGFSRAEDMAFPLGADPNLFSGDAVISYAFGSLVYAISGNPFAGINLLFLLSFPVVSVLALACIRSVGLKGPWAIVLSVSFSFIPFHIWRGLEHIHLSLLFGATAGMLIVLLVMKGTWKEWTEGKPTATSRWRIIGVGALVLVAAWTSLYFAVFSSVLLLAAVVWRWTRGDGTATLFRALALPLSAIAAIALSLLPALLARQQTPGGTSVATREPLESVTYAGNLFVAILPAPIVKQFEAYNQFIFTNLQNWPDRNESMWLSNYGTWISVMCLGIFIFGLGWSARRRQRPNAFSNRPSPSENFPLTGLAYLVVVTLLFFVPWGLNFLFAAGLSGQIRAWNRFAPILILLFILGAAACLSRWRWPHNRPVSITAALVGVLLIAFTQVLPLSALVKAYADGGANRLNAAFSYTQKVKAFLSDGCGVFTFPSMKYPNAGGYDSIIQNYDHLYLLLPDNGLAISYGGHQGTPETEIADRFEEITLSQSIDIYDVNELKALGFCGAHLDRGEKEKSEPLHGQLWTLLGEPEAVSADGRWEFFSFN